MKTVMLGPFTSVLFACTLSGLAQLPPRKPVDPNPWNGTWTLDATRSTPGVEGFGVPKAYRFLLGPGDVAVVPIKWEIPELGEVVTGSTDGKAMPVLRSTPTPGLTLSVKTDGPACLLYSVFKNGRLQGGGRMMLVDNGKAWVDLTWPDDRQDLAAELVYVKQ